MQIGIVGLGRMGANISRRLMRAGHKTVVYDINVSTREALGKDGATPVASLADMVNTLDTPRALWVMLPAGPITESTVTELATLLKADDIIIDGGNSYYKDDIRRAKTFEAAGIHSNDDDRSRPRVGSA